MSGLMRDVEQEFSGGQSNQQGGDNYDNQQGDMNQQGGGMGGGYDQSNQQQGNFDQQSGGMGGQGLDQQQGNMDQQSGGGESKKSGGFLSSMESTGKDAMVDQEINSFANKEGIPAGADGFIDNAVNSEVNKF